MIFLPYADLLISEDRQRRQFDETALQDLSSSIQRLGLMHPLVVRPLGDGKWQLVAGERRSIAIKSLHALGIPFLIGGKHCPAGQFPCVPMGDLNAFDAEEAELDENLKREDLTWQEEASAIARLAKLRQTQADAKTSALGLPPVRVTATSIAQELVEPGKVAHEGDLTKVTTSVILAQHLDDPEVAKAKSPKEAIKILKKKATAEHRATLAASFDQSSLPHRLHHGDSLEWMRTLPDNSVDLVLTDPPYGIGADTFGDQASTGHSYKDTPEYAIDCYRGVFQQAMRFCKPQATLFAFCSIEMWPVFAAEATMHGWYVWSRPLIWNKTNGMLPKPDYGPRYTYEAILFATKGDARVQRVGAADVLTFPSKGDIEHGAQKPVDLYVDLISRSVLPGSVVVDPFAGSGTIFPAANKAKVRALGCEISKEYYDLALSRMQEKDNLGDLLKGIPS
jgi:site-specific DNA-methyltransferase (adenine-specific)